MNYNLDKVKDLADGDEEFVQSVVGVFVEETPDDLNDLKNAVNDKIFDRIYQCAHKIKSNVALFNMEEARSLILSIEAETKGEKDIHKIEKYFTQVEDIINITIIELEVKHKL